MNESEAKAASDTIAQWKRDYYKTSDELKVATEDLKRLRTQTKQDAVVIATLARRIKELETQ
jgi:hypothetical protein